MTEKKRKRYPADRQKLHALLEKREQELIELQEEVEELRRLAASGYCEVVLTAISLPSYGKDTGTHGHPCDSGALPCYPGTACGDHAVHVRGRSAFRAVPE